MKILITGGTGFIGSHLVRSFEAEYDWKVFAPTHKELDLLSFESCQAYFQNNYFDIVIHAACPRNYTKQGITVVNLYEKMFMMFSNLFFFTTKSRCFNLGSGAEYQEMELGRAKRNINWVIHNSMNWINLRLFGVFGMGEQPMRFFPSIFKEIITSQTITIQNPDNRFSWIDISDLCFIMRVFCRHAPKENDYDVCNSELQTLGYWGEYLSSYFNVKLILGKYPRSDYCGNNTSLIEEMNSITHIGCFKPMKISIINYYQFFLSNQTDQFNKRWSEFKGEDHI